MTKDEFIHAVAALVIDLQVPMSLDGELAARGGHPLLARAQLPWTELHRGLVGFGYGDATEVEHVIRKLIAEEA